MHWSLEFTLGDLVLLISFVGGLLGVFLRYERRLVRLEERLEPLWRDFLRRLKPVDPP